MGKRVFKRFDINVDTALQKYSQVFELDPDIVAIHGIHINSEREEQTYYRGSQRIEINREEIFPEGFQSKLLMSGLTISPNDRFYRFTKTDLGDHKIKIDYQDASSYVAFTAYKAGFYFDCELKD
jgi:hypothetical protein